jgi:hypothetical protein
MPVLRMSGEHDDDAILDERGYHAALEQLEGLLLSDPDTPAGRRFDGLVRLVEEYEARRGGYLLFRRRG